MEFACSMCYFMALSHSHLMQHIIRYHQHDPQFKVQCVEEGCGGTFTKWKSFRQHLHRKHRYVPPALDNIDQHSENMYNINDIDGDLINRNISEDETMPEPILESAEYLQWKAAKFILNIRENCKVSSATMEKIIDGVTSLIDVYLSIIMKEIEKRKNRNDPEVVALEDVKVICTEEYPPRTIFTSMSSKIDFDKILVEKFNMVAPLNVIIGKELRWKRKNSPSGPLAVIKEVTYEGYIIPLLDNLKNLLGNAEIRSNIEDYRKQDDGILRTVLDGSFYQENEFFKHKKHALAIILYYDDLGVVNMCGSAAKTQKLSMFYWSLANIKPEVRSTLDTVQLYAILKTEHLKKPNGLQKILDPFISDINILQTDGINIIVDGQIKNYKGSLLFVAGDTPASSVLGGVKESVAAYRPCRSCETTMNEWQTRLTEDLVLRNKTNHQEHLEIITDPTIKKSARDFWQKQYGVNSRSPLLNIPHFDLTMCLPQDCMHVLLEGVMEISCRAFLRYCIIEKALFNINDLNKRLESFDFKQFKNDKPGSILISHLAIDNNLKQSAAQMFGLLHTIPFIIGEWITSCTDEDILERIYCYELMLQILNVCLAYEIHEDLIDILRRMIDTFFFNTKQLYPDIIVPKFHFMQHIPQYIRLFGPARQQWCFRFEATHAYFKGLASVTRNFKNMALTLTYRHQARLCSRLSSYPGMPTKKFLYQGDYIAPGNSILMCNLAYAQIFRQLVDNNQWFSCLMMRTSKIIVYGTSYKLNNIILLQNEEYTLPTFGKISDIFIFQEKKLLVYSSLRSILFEPKLNAYQVKKRIPEEKLFIAVKDLLFPYSLNSFTVKGIEYIPLINHERTEFLG